MINPNWGRWLFASFSKHFSDGLSNDAFVYVEGQLRETNSQTSYYEVRVDGPYITEIARNRYELYSEVNILCSANHVVDNNAHRIHDMTGLAASLFTNVMAYQYGDDNAYFGCLELVQNKKKRERIQISHFGQIDPNVPLIQATVEGHYLITIQT